jgi:hypothetical protein
MKNTIEASTLLDTINIIVDDNFGNTSHYNVCISDIIKFSGFIKEFIKSMLLCDLNAHTEMELPFNIGDIHCCFFEIFLEIFEIKSTLRSSTYCIKYVKNKLIFNDVTKICVLRLMDFLLFDNNCKNIHHAHKSLSNIDFEKYNEAGNEFIELMNESHNINIFEAFHVAELTKLLNVINDCKMMNILFHNFNNLEGAYCCTKNDDDIYESINGNGLCNIINILEIINVENIYNPYIKKILIIANKYKSTQYYNLLTNKKITTDRKKIIRNIKDIHKKIILTPSYHVYHNQSDSIHDICMRNASTGEMNKKKIMNGHIQMIYSINHNTYVIETTRMNKSYIIVSNDKMIEMTFGSHEEVSKYDIIKILKNDITYKYCIFVLNNVSQELYFLILDIDSHMITIDFTNYYIKTLNLNNHSSEMIKINDGHVQEISNMFDGDSIAQSIIKNRKVFTSNLFCYSDGKIYMEMSNGHIEKIFNLIEIDDKTGACIYHENINPLKNDYFIFFLKKNNMYNMINNANVENRDDQFLCFRKYAKIMTIVNNIMFISMKVNDKLLNISFDLQTKRIGNIHVFVEKNSHFSFDMFYQPKVNVIVSLIKRMSIDDESINKYIHTIYSRVMTGNIEYVVIDKKNVVLESDTHTIFENGLIARKFNTFAVNTINVSIM